MPRQRAAACRCMLVSISNIRRGLSRAGHTPLQSSAVRLLEAVRAAAQPGPLIPPGADTPLDSRVQWGEDV